MADNKETEKSNSMGSFSMDSEGTPILNPLGTHDRFPNRSQLVKPLTYWEALLHLLKACVGPGILGLPYAFRNAGLYGGAILLTVMVAINWYALRLLPLCSHYFCMKNNLPGLDYGNLTKFAVLEGPIFMRPHWRKVKLTVNSFIAVANILCCSVYLLYLGKTFHEVILLYTNWKPAVWVCTTLWMPVLLVLVSIRQLKSLVYVALVLLICYLVGIVVIYEFLLTNTDMIASNNASAFNLASLPVAFGGIAYTFEGATYVLPVENQVHDPARFVAAGTGVISMTYIFVYAIGLTLGFLGYLVLGDNTQAAITLNLPKHWPYEVCKAAVAVAMLGNLVMLYYVIIERVDKYISRKVRAERQTLYMYLGRYVGISFVYLVAVLVGNLGLLMALCGSFLMSALSFIFPCVIHLLTEHSRSGFIAKRHLIIDVLVISIGILGAVVGGVSSFMRLVGGLEE